MESVDEDYAPHMSHDELISNSVRATYCERKQMELKPKQKQTTERSREKNGEASNKKKL